MDNMEQQLLEYFHAEKQGSLVFLILGLLSILIAGFLLKSQGIYKGVAYPFIVIAWRRLLLEPLFTSARMPKLARSPGN